MGRVFVIGSINDDIVVLVSRHPRVGETLVGSDLKHFPGGKGANQAVAAARAQADTTMIGLVGEDAAGKELVDYLTGAGVNTSLIESTDAAPTGTALITVADGDNTIVVVAGANGLLGQEHMKNFTPEKGDVVLAQFETPIETTIAAFEVARSVGATTILNPAPAAAVPGPLLGLVDILVVNEHEFALLFGQEPSQAEMISTARRAGYQGSLVVTLGSDGVIAASDDATVRYSGHSVAAVDSTGAGDCFVGYVAAGIVQGLAFDLCLERANLAAAISVTRPGAASSIPTVAEVDAWR